MTRSLIAQGLNPGDRVGLKFNNADVISFEIAYMAVHKAGAVSVPLNPRLGQRDLAAIIEHCLEPPGSFSGI